MKKQWNVTVNGVQHEIVYKKGFAAKLIVDGQAHKLKSQNPFLLLIDCPVTIDGAEVRVVVIGNKVDLAVNGIYQSNQEAYIPIRKIDAWANVLLGISCIGGYLLSGILGMAIGFLFGYLYIKQDLKGNKGVVIGSFIGCTVIQAALVPLYSAMGII